MYENPFHEQPLDNLTFLVTGGAGFIGSNIVEYLLKYGVKKVRTLDNYSNGFRKNLALFADDSRLEIIEGDIRDAAVCAAACEGVDVVLHEAALGSVPRSIKDPVLTNDVNVGGHTILTKALSEREMNAEAVVSRETVR